MKRLPAWLVVMLIGTPVFAQERESRFGISDNSFLVEEAFNQEPGIFQNIFVMSRVRGGGWTSSLTQEWPVKTMRHQASFTLPFERATGTSAVGTLGLNYRYQLTEAAGRMPAVSPRVTVLLPTGTGFLGEQRLGWEANVPASLSAGRLFFHGNVGARFEHPARHTPATDRWTKSPFAGGSVLVAVTPLVNLMFETVVAFDGRFDGGHETSTTYSPGIRTGWNLGTAQLVLGAAVPVTRGATRDTALLAYLSYELPFTTR